MNSLLDVCLKTMDWTERRGYAGYGKFDALNSPILHRIAGKSALRRSAIIYLVSRAPFNLRPLLGVEKRQNPKALALLARTCFILHTLTEDEAWTTKARRLLSRLLELSQLESYAGHCWGAEHPRANPRLGAEPYFPGAVVTCEVTHAFLDAFERTRAEEYLDVAKSAAQFITRDLDVMEEGESGLCLSYAPGYPTKVINSNAKTACVLARLAATTGDEKLDAMARSIMTWVLSRQTESGAWFYADPDTASHVKHDNYHTAFVLNSILQFVLDTKDRSSVDAYDRGLRFYEENLFLPSGAPKWRHDRLYPLDVKGAAQGILTFCLASQIHPGKEVIAERIGKWMIDKMWNPEGRFYYQKGRFWTKKYTLIRWCQAWTCYALTTLALLGQASTTR